MNKTFTFMAGALMLLTVSHARADSWLVVNSQAAPQSFSLDNIRTLTFADGKLVVNTYDAAAAASFNLADLTTLTFSDNDPNAIAPVAIEGKGVLRYANGNLFMEGAGNVNAALYTVSGNCLMRINNWDGTAVATSSLPNGVYIFKADQQAIKFIKK